MDFFIRVIRVIRGYAFTDEPVFNFLSCPGRFTQERQTGLYARIELETPDRDAPPHLAPTMPLDKLIDNVLQRDAVQGIAGMGNGRCHVTILESALSLKWQAFN
jgi:hypothetical protein